MVAKATLNKELRHLKAILRTAWRWKYLAEVPEIEFVRETKRLPEFISPEVFAKLYEAACVATRPGDIANVDSASWWRGLLVTGFMTGWRIGELLALKWSDVDLEAGTAITRGDENKGRCDAKIALHPLVVEHIEKVRSFDARVFPWNFSRRTLYTDFHRLQRAGGVKSANDYHGFHDLRRGFATMNADRMSADALQALMRHTAYKTTQVYINLSRQLSPAVANLFVPQLPGEKRQG